MKKTKMSLQTLSSIIIATGLSPIALCGDSIIVEGDLDVQATGSASGDVRIDNILTVNTDESVIAPAVKSAFKVEENGVIWAGQASDFDAVDLYPYDDGSYFIWWPQRGSLIVGETDLPNWQNGPLDPVGYHSISFGENSIAKGDSSLAGGLYSSANGDHSFAMGEMCSSGPTSFAVGAASEANGVSSSVIGGNSSKAIGNYSVAWGYGSEAHGMTSTSIGESSMAYGHASFALGLMTAAYSQGSITIGGYNLGINTEADSDFGWYDLDSVFEIGNGTSSSNLSNAVTVLKNGQTTLTNKAWKTELEGTDPLGDPSDMANSSEGEALVVEGHAHLKGKVTLAEAQGDIDMGIYGN